MIRYKLIIYSNINDHVYTRNNSYTCPSTVSLSQRVHMPILEYHLAFFLWKVTQSLLEGTLLYCNLFDFFLTFYLGSLSYPESLYSGTLKDVNLNFFLIGPMLSFIIITGTATIVIIITLFKS